MSNIRIDIASEFKDKGFKAAEKRTTSLSRKFDNLGRTAKRTFVAIAGIQALKRSVVAFAEEDRAANRLEASLRNLGLAYNTQAIEDYLEQSEKATAISKDELSPAIAGLLSTTLDAEKSMTLLGLAMDISASTGRDLTSVTTALSRAFNGNFASLGKLQTAYTTAELEAMGFEQSVSALNNEFGGAAKNNADTYAGQIDKLKIAFGDLAEEIGAGIVSFLESLGSGDYDKGLQKLVDFGTAIGNVFRRAGLSIEYTKALLATGFRIDAAEQFKLDELRAQLANPQMGEFGVQRGLVRDYVKQLELQKKIVKEREKAAKLSEKEKKNQSVLAKSKALFDLEKIQIQAALQGKITQEERTRLELMQAILNEDADTAEKLAERLVEIQEESAKLAERLKEVQENTKELAESLLGLEAGDPFEKWDEYFADAKKNVKDLYDFLAAQQKLLNDITLSLATSKVAANASVLAAKTDKATAFKEASEASKDFAKISSEDAAKILDAAKKAIEEATTAEEKAAAEEGLEAAESYVDATDLLTESLAAADLAAALAGLELANEYLNQSIEAATDQNLIPDVNITVNVEGNVTTQEDLVGAITDQLYQYQKSGKGLLFSSVAI